MNPRNAWPTVIIAAVAMAIVGTMAILKVDKDTILLVMGTIATPVIGTLLAAQVAETRGAVSNVVTNTNGLQTRTLEVLDRMAQMLGASQPTVEAVPPSSAPPAPAPPELTGGH